MDENNAERSSWMAGEFERQRGRLHSVAYRMLGSLADADDALQEAWLRVDRADIDDIANPAGWLTTVTARVCLNMVRARSNRHEEPNASHVPDPVIQEESTGDPAFEAVLADSVGLAMLVVLQTLGPAERLAFILHDMFAVPFDEIASMLDRTPEAVRQLASRARMRVRSAPVADADLAHQRVVVDAFFAAARAGDFDALVTILAPNVRLRADGGPSRPGVSAIVHGAEVVAGRAIMFSAPGAIIRPVVVNGSAGIVATTAAGEPISVMAFTVVDDRVVAIDVLADPDRLRQLPGITAAS
ncbi:MAG: polymerase, sigma-24 subunit, subfamily [Ilumatobacteraceae bacterium]|nr:polymerase, sigma-24 subunit, subfamily [Ilumatobacteraceae bacterium]